MKNLRSLMVILASFFANMTYSQFILTLNYDQMDPYIGMAFQVRVTEIASGHEVGRKSISMIEASDFSMQLYVLLQQRSYNVDFYVDVNGSGGYDSPPVDHAWRRTVNNPTQHTAINFSPDKNYTDIGFPDPFPFSTYDAVWGGRWRNLTFGSTDSIMAGITLRCDSVFGFFTTKGIFGNPNTMTFDYANERPSGKDPAPDTIRYTPDAPWSGEVLIIDEQLIGDLTAFGLGLDFIGTIGAKQVLALYNVTMSGNIFANGYFYIKELDINGSTPELIIELTANGEVSCFDGEDGFLSTNAIGGLPGYTYLWSNGETTAQISNLAAGDYTVTVTDALGCTEAMTYSIGQPEQIVTTWFTDQVSCNGLCDGNIDIIMIGGVPPYTFSWSNGLTTEDAFDLCAGTYQLTTTDAAGCVVSAPITVFEPDIFVIENIVIIDESNSQSDGVIEMSVSGGVPPYQYSINGGSFQASNIFTGLSAGIYEVCSKDANDCIECAEIVIQNLTAIHEPEATFKWYPNPVSSFIHFEADLPLSIDMLDIQGHRIRHIPSGINPRIQVEDFVPGIYFLKISDGVDVAYRKVVVE